MTTTIKTITICALFDNLGYTIDQLIEMDLAQESKIVMDWCKANNYHYYAAPKESFFAFEGIAQAEELGCSGVVLEDLS